MEKFIIEKIKDEVIYIDGLVAITRDSCEFNLYSTQQTALEVACKHIRNICELLSKINVE